MDKKEREKSPAAVLFGQLLADKNVVVGGAIVLIMILIAVFAPILAPHDPTETNSSMILAAPSAEYLFGTDELGRCVLSRMIYGARVTIPYSIYALLVAIVIGVPLGLISGYYHKLDNLIMRLMDILMAFPGILILSLIHI